MEILQYDTIEEIGNSLGTFIGIEQNDENSTEVKILIDVESRTKTLEPLEVIIEVEGNYIVPNFYLGPIHNKLIIVNLNVKKYESLGLSQHPKPQLDEYKIRFNKQIGGFIWDCAPKELIDKKVNQHNYKKEVDEKILESKEELNKLLGEAISFQDEVRRELSMVDEMY